MQQPAQDRRREQRLQIRKPEQVEVTLCHRDNRGTESVSAELQDISLSGAQLLCPKLLVYYQSADLIVKCEDPKFELSFAAEVCWMKPAPQGKWLLGCSFVPELPAGVLENLMAREIVERRRLVRQTQRVAVLASWEQSGETLPAYVWDFSPEGFCILSPGKSGRQVTVRGETPQPPVELKAEALWDIKMAGGYVAGCKVLEDDGYDRMQQLAASENGQRSPASKGLLDSLRGAVDALLGRSS